MTLLQSLTALTKERDELKAQLERLQKREAAMREALAIAKRAIGWESLDNEKIMGPIRAALQPDAGSSFVPRAELEKAEKQAAAYLMELQFWTGAKHEGACEFSDKSDEGCWLCTKAERERWLQTKAILDQPEAGSDFIRREGVKPLVEALRRINEISVIDEDMGCAVNWAGDALEHAKILGLL